MTTVLPLRDIACPAGCPSGAQETPSFGPESRLTLAEQRVPFGLIGLSHRTAPLEVRSRIGLDPEGVRLFLREAKERGLRECVVLSTCNRLEVYYAGGSASMLIGMLEARAGVPLREYLVEKHCGCAACHAFRVASGLDSAVLGETEIVAQVKSAWAHSREEGMAGPMLDLLLQRALEASKRVRSETELCRAVTSTASLAVRTVRERLGGLGGRRTLVIGAGQIARRLALELHDAGAEVVVVNRTLARAEGLAELVGAEAQPLDALEAETARADAVFAAAGTTEPILSRDLLARVSARRGGWPLPVVDMGVPPNVEPGVAGIDLTDLDTLTQRTAEGEQARLDTLPAALDILQEELARFHATLAQRTAAPTIRALVAHGDEIRARNLEWAKERLPNLGPKEMRIVEEMARRLTIGLLEGPIDGLKGDLSAREHRHVVEQLFGLTSGERGN